MVAEALAAKILFGELQRLDLGAHGAVEHEDALGRRFAQGALDIGAVGGLDLVIIRHRHPGPRSGTRIIITTSS